MKATNGLSADNNYTNIKDAMDSLIHTPVLEECACLPPDPEDVNKLLKAIVSRKLGRVQVHKLPHKVKMEYVHFTLHINYFLLPYKFPEEISRQSVFFNIYKGSIYHIKHMSVQPFTMGVD